MLPNDLLSGFQDMCQKLTTVFPHAYQLKAAAQADWLCEGPFWGILIGDGMGLGKTLMATIAMCRHPTTIEEITPRMRDDEEGWLTERKETVRK